MNIFFYDYEKFDYDKKIAAMSADFGEILAALEKDVKKTTELVRDYEKDNPQITKDVINNITCGYSVDESIIMTALKLGQSRDKVRAVYDVHRYDRLTTINYAKNYLIHKLREKGFKIIDIAFILDCNKQTVYNYLKKDFIP